MEQKIDSNWQALFINEFGNKWIKNVAQDTVLTICAEYRNPIEIKPSQGYEIILSQVEKEGEYRANKYFRYSQIINPDSPDKKISISYLVSK